MKDLMNCQVDLYNRNMKQVMKVRECSEYRFQLFIDGQVITEGDVIDIYDRVKCLNHENGLNWTED